MVDKQSRLVRRRPEYRRFVFGQDRKKMKKQAKRGKGQDDLPLTHSLSFLHSCIAHNKAQLLTAQQT